jgi:hypothetical protein
VSYQPAVPVESPTYRHFAVSTMSRPQPLRGVLTATPTSQAWPLANLAIYVPIYFNEACTIYEVGCGAGATAGGNWDIGLYTMAGAKIQTSGTRPRTLSAWNPFDWTDLVVAPGWYYAAMAADSTANYSGVAPAAGLAEATGICEQQTAFVLPATATMVRTTRAFVPTISFSVRSVTI